jgi:hypothetical protein
METVERGLHELDVLGLKGKAERLHHQLGLGPLEHPPCRRQRLRDARGSRRSLRFLLRPLDAICNATYQRGRTAPSLATERS